MKTICSIYIFFFCRENKIKRPLLIFYQSCDMKQDYDHSTHRYKNKKRAIAGIPGIFILRQVITG